MRRYMDARYIPYIRTRYREPAGRSIPAGAFFRDSVVFIRYILCIACLVLTLINIGNKYKSAVLTITESHIMNIINEHIDNGVARAKSSFRESDFIVINNRGEKVLSVKNDVLNAGELALALSESILAELKNIEHKLLKRNFGGIMENGMLASLVINAPIRIVPVGKVSVTPEFSTENSKENQKVHRLSMEISVKIKILFPFHREERQINRVFVISETIIP